MSRYLASKDIWFGDNIFVSRSIDSKDTGFGDNILCSDP